MPQAEVVRIDTDWLGAGVRRACHAPLGLHGDGERVGVFVCADSLAAGVYAAARDAGRGIPDSILVVGFDDLRGARTATPPLTTVHQPIREMAAEAVGMLVRAASGEQLVPETVVLPTTLVVRGSTRLAAHDGEASVPRDTATDPTRSPGEGRSSAQSDRIGPLRRGIGGGYRRSNHDGGHHHVDQRRTSEPHRGRTAGDGPRSPVDALRTPIGHDRRTRVPIIVKGEGHRIWDSAGKEYLDGLAGLFVVNAGHGRKRLAQAAAKQAEQLAFFPIWSYAHPAAIELADRIAEYAPGDLNHVFFSTGGGEAVETAFKLAKYYWKIQGQPNKHKVISRSVAYHGTPQGALAITGIPAMKAMFEPVTPGGFRVPNTNFYRASDMGAPSENLEEFGVWAADRIEEMIQFEGPDTVAAVFLEPVQNSGGCFPPPPGYFQRVREICDRYDVLLVSDEVICAFGRIGHMFACDAYGYQPDMITFAKAVTSGYSPLGGTVVSDKIYEPFTHGDRAFYHGYTFGGHPVSAAVALENLDIFEEEGLNERVRENSPIFRSTLEKLTDLPIVGDVRGDGYFFGIELVKDKTTKETFDDDESERLLRGFLSKALFDAGLYCRADDRGDPVIQLAPPLTMGPAEFDQIEQILRSVLTEAWARL